MHTIADTRIPVFIGDGLSSMDKVEVHRRGLRHPAVSVFVLDGGATLMQRRARTKYHTPGLWTNSCCTHPRMGEDPMDCAKRRLDEELGISGVGLTHAGQIEYRAEVGSGMTEHEVVDVYVARASRSITIHPNPAEVMAVRWETFADLDAEMARAPQTFTPWFRHYLADHRARIFGAFGA